MASIIRKRGATPPAARMVQPVAFQFEDINDRANEYLETVRREAAKIVQQAHQQAEQVRRQAEAAGRAAAEEAAQRVLDERVGARINTLLPALQTLVAELNLSKTEWLKRWEHSALSVAVSIAERIIRREVAQRPEITLEWITEALRLAAGAGDLTLRLNPLDHEHLGSHVDRIAKTLGHLASAKIVADPAVTVGGCVVETQFGEIDQRIESQLARIQAELK